MIELTPFVPGDFRIRIWDEDTDDTLFSGYVSSMSLTSEFDADSSMSPYCTSGDEVTITLYRNLYPPHNFLWRVAVSNNWLSRFGGVVRRIRGVHKARKKVRSR